MTRFKSLCSVTVALLLPCGALATHASGQSPTGEDRAMLPLSERPTLLGGPGSPEAWLSEQGLNLDISFTGFGQSMLAPSAGDNGMQWGGKLNAKLGFDFSNLGLWKGFSASALYEHKWGDSVNGFNGALLPINTQLYEPNGVDSALSLTFTQRFSKEFSLTAGKFNMVDAASASPIVGGGGWQSPDNPSQGWGVFGQAFIADGNPNTYRWFVNGGVAGTSPISGRGVDRFGVGFFNTSFSKDLTGSLTTITGFHFGDERGIEASYNAAIAPWFRVALDLQYIRPGVRDFDNVLFTGISAQIKL